MENLPPNTRLNFTVEVVEPELFRNKVSHSYVFFERDKFQNLKFYLFLDTLLVGAKRYFSN